MYTVLLVDDESMILNTLKEIIPWDTYGIHCIFEANDGLSALQILEKSRVDILVTDISMPYMNGIELLKVVRKIYPKTHCVLLTAYSEFEYAKTAIQLGIDNYLLKPINPDEVEGTIKLALDSISSNQDSFYSLFQNSILLRWVQGTISSVELDERSQILRINTFLSNYCTVCVKSQGNNRCFTNFRSQLYIKFAESYETHSFWDDKGYFVVVIAANELTVESIRDDIEYVLKKVTITDSLLISIGTVVFSSNDVFQSYKICRELLETSNIYYPKQLILTDRMLPSKKDKSKLADLLFTYFSSSSKAYRKELSETLLREYSSAKTIEQANQTLSEFCQAITRILSQMFPNNSDIQQKMYRHLSRYKVFPSEKQQRDELEKLLIYGYSIYRMHLDILSPIVKKALKYIENSYSESISIKEFCAANKVGTSYLGFLFKEETGFYFSDFLLQYRIVHAMNLLNTTNLKIADVAGKVGFSSTSYFIQCFRRQTGLSPNKYRSAE